MARYRAELNPRRPDAHRALQLALDAVPAGDPEPEWVRALLALGNGVGADHLGALEARERLAIERWGAERDEWLDERGEPLVVFEPLA